MESYQQRVIEDEQHLREKVYELETFVLSEKITNIPLNEAEVMRMQLHHMIGYLECLRSRIKSWRV